MSRASIDSRIGASPDVDGDAVRSFTPLRRLSSAGSLHLKQILLFVSLMLFWYVATETGLLPKFFFGQPVHVFEDVIEWVTSGEIFYHLAITLEETIFGFAIGAILALICGLWLALSATASALCDPYIKGLNAMPRVILAPIFSLWFGLGIWSKVALGVTLVFFVVFFNVYQGIREVSPVVLANSRMLGASQQQLLRTVYLPSATSWVFSSLHTSVGMAFVGAVVGEYLGSAGGIGYLILQAEGVFDINTVFAGIVVLTIFALILDGVVSVLEHRLLKWRPI
jgi:NitT/TauT family transport system permease protein